MNLLTVVYSRMSSSRFPEKALSLVANKPLFEHVVNSLLPFKELGSVIVGTSNDISDDKLVAYSDKKKIPYFRGDLYDVALRTQQILTEYQPNLFCRVCSDRPLLTPDFIKYAKTIFLAKHTEYDVITNMSSKFDPAGLRIEFIKTKTFIDYSNQFEFEEREHITKYFYNEINFEKSKIFNFNFNQEDHSSVNLCVDTIDDLANVNFVLEEIDNKSLEYNHHNVFNLIKYG